MKRFIFLILGVLLISITSYGQYRVNKKQYDYKSYAYQVGDPYNPTIAGVASFLIPGLGQMISGEGGRGVGFLAGSFGSFIIFYVGAVERNNYINNGSGGSSSGTGLMLVGLGSAIGVEIWSVVDAVRVAKVNNLAFRANNKTSMDLKVEPFLMNIGALNNENYISTGLTLKMTFSNHN